MNTKEDILNFLHQNKEAYCKAYSITKLGLFGSFARDEAKPTSDVDVLISYEEGASDLFTKKQALKKALKDSLGVEIDIANEKYLHQYVKEQILKEAIFV
jgi:uncharacterized protein